MRRYVINASLIVAYFATVLVIAASHYAISQAIRPTPDGVPGPMAGATLLGLLLLAALPFAKLWRRAPEMPDADDPLAADDE